MASSGINISLKSYDSIFQNDEQRNSEEIKPVPISELKPFEQQPFKVLLDESVASITSKLQFVENATTAEAKSAIYSQPSVMGYSIVAPSNGGDETEVNLETLFNATLGNSDKISEIFNAK